MNANAAIAIGVCVARLGYAATAGRFGVAFGVHGARHSAVLAAVHDTAFAGVSVARGPGFALVALVAVGRSATVGIGCGALGRAHAAFGALEAVVAGLREAGLVDALVAGAAASVRARGPTLARQFVDAQARLGALELDAVFAFAALVVVFTGTRRLRAEATSREWLGRAGRAGIAVFGRATGLPGNVGARLDPRARGTRTSSRRARDRLAPAAASHRPPGSGGAGAPGAA